MIKLSPDITDLAIMLFIVNVPNNDMYVRLKEKVTRSNCCYEKDLISSKLIANVLDSIKTAFGLAHGEKRFK